MILDNEFTGDPRVENEVLALQNAGHQVFVLCFNYGQKSSQEDFYGATIVRRKINLTVKNKLKGLNNTIFNFYPKYWSKLIIAFVKEFQIETLHIHDLWMLEGGLLANKQLDLPIVVDLHENFVHALKHYKYSTTFPGNLIISMKRWEKKELEWLNGVDHIIVVIEEAKARLEKLGIPSSKIIVVANYVNIEEYSKEDEFLTKSLTESYQNYKTLVYTGGFDKHRGLDILLDAIPDIIKKFPDFRLILVGGGSTTEELKTQAQNLKIEENVDFPGYLPHSQLVSYVKMSDVCIIPHLKTDHTDNTIPHKLFQYMLMEKPVIASNSKPVERIINKVQSGLIYQYDNSQDLAKKLLMLIDNPQLINELGKKGREAVISEYNWKQTAKNLIALYHKIHPSID